MSAKITLSKFREKLSSTEMKLVGDEKKYPSFSLQTEVRLVCGCGKEFIKKAWHIWNNKTKSCGCYKKRYKGTGKLGTASKYTYGDIKKKLAEYQVSLVGDYKDQDPVVGIKIIGAHKYICRCGKVWGDRVELDKVFRGNTTSCGCNSVHCKSKKTKKIRTKKKALSIGENAGLVFPSKYTYGDVKRKLKQYGISLIGDFQDTCPVIGMRTKGYYTYLCKCGKRWGKKVCLYTIFQGKTVSCGCRRAIAAKENGIAKRGKYTKKQKRAAEKRYSIVKEEILDICQRLNLTWLNPTEKTHTRYIMTLRCKCGQTFEVRALDIKRGMTKSCGCLKSWIEQDLYNYVHELDSTAIKNDRKLIAPLETDVLVPGKLAIELDGLYWHGEKVCGKSAKTAGKIKCQQYKEKGIRSLFVYEDEWNYRRPAVEGYIKGILGLKPTIGARQTEVVPGGQDFVEANHIQGAAKRSRHTSLVHKGEVVAVASFAPIVGRRATGPNQWELTRYCVGEISVAGGLSKLLKHFAKTQDVTSYVTFSDNRLSQGHIYRTIGFRQVSEVDPRYSYVIGDRREHRFKYRKQALAEKGWLEEGETEWECMQRQGFDRVWDCGKVKWILDVSGF